MFLLTQWRQRAFGSSVRGKSIFQKFCEQMGASSLFCSTASFPSFGLIILSFLSSGAIKIFAHPIMALIVLTEPDFEEALTRLMKRCAYVVVPVSILWIKYYPQLGMITTSGAAANDPGHLRRQKLAGCRLSDPGFLFLLAFAANLANRTEHSATKRASVDRRVLDRYLVALLRLSHSATSAICSICSDTGSRVCRHPSYN